MCELVRAAIEFPVGEMLVFESECDGFRRPLNLGLKLLVEADQLRAPFAKTSGFA